MKKIYFLVIVFLGLFANGQVINFTDPVFKTRLVQATASSNTAVNLAGNYFRIDSNFNSEIEVSEALQVKELYLDQSLITNLAGIGNFVNLYKLNCSGNNISNLDFEGLPNLFNVNCYSNNMNTIDLQGLSNLRFLNCGSNNLSTIDFSDTPYLSTFHCGLNNFTSFDLAGLSSLYRFDCNSNEVTVLYNLEDCTFLEDLFIDSNLFTSIDLSVLPALMRFYGSYNLFSTIDLSNNPLMNTIDLHGNPNLSSFFCKNGVSELYMVFENCPNLNYICSDDFQTERNILTTKIAQYGYNCELNSYCSFVPGGEYYAINGEQRFDNNANGCDSNDISISNFRINKIESGNIVGSYINNLGNYSIPVQAGTYTYVPVMENPSYFTISPSSFDVTFPTQASPFIQNICVTPNGIHNDLSVSFLPIIPARPGFDATYKIVYKNKGNTVLSGNVTFTYNDGKTDFISSLPVFSSQLTNQIIWDFADLQPFETREINLVLNINSPMETPAVNVGDQINFTTNINPTVGDEHLNDNVSRLKQIVVGSVDPNDKTCVEGNVVGPEMIGEYVTYIIRFENTGTFAAENIVVKDIIDISKYDLATLIPVSSSHSFVTRIANDGKVEFIFENVNLPFDNATNDGYVAFKIKTLPSLVVGNTFSNKASIYFDYNFPIDTNTASTTISALSNQDFEFSNYMSLFPNPAKNVLNITTKNNSVISSICIYNTIGQLVLVTTNPTESIDVSNLKTGNYFIKVISDKGILNNKFIKQ